MPLIKIVRTTTPPEDRTLPSLKDEIVIFPYETAVKSAERILLKERGVIFGANFVSIGRLADELGQSILCEKIIAKRSHKKAIMLKLLLQSERFSKFAYDVVDDFLSIAEWLENTEPESQPEFDYQKEALKIVQKYFSELDSAGFITIQNLYRLLAKSINKSLPQIAGKDRLIVRGFIELTDAEAEFVMALARVFDETIIEIEREPAREYSSLFVPSIILEHKIKRLAKMCSIGVKIVDERHTQAAIETLLKAIAYPESKDLKPPFRYIAIRDRFEEVSYVMSEIKEKAQCIPLDEFLILVPSLDRYAPIIELLSKSCGLNVDFVGYHNLHKSGIIRTLLGLLEGARKGLTFHNLLRYCEDPHLDFVARPSRSSIKAILPYANFWGINYEAIIKALDESPGEELVQAFNFYREIQNLINPFTKELCPGSAAENLRDLVSKFSSTGEAEKKAKECALNLINELPVLAELMGKSKLNAGELIAIILTEASERSLPTKSGGIKVSLLEEGAFIYAKEVYILGMVEGEFPPVELENAIFTRAELKRLGIKRTDPQWRNLFAYLRNAGRQSSNVTVLYPTLDGEDELIPSYLIFPFAPCREQNERLNSSFKLQIALGREYSSLYAPVSEIKLLKKAIPENLKRLMHLQFVRHFREPLNEYSGIIRTEQGKRALAEILHKKTIMSASKIERYINCPFRFFVEEILGLRSPEIPQEELPSVDLGNLIHKILYQFYRDRIVRALGKEITRENLDEIKDMRKKLEDVRVSEHNIDEAKSEIEGIVNQVLTEQLLPKYPHLVGAYREKIISILYDFLERELEDRKGIPIMLEASFGVKHPGGVLLFDRPFQLSDEFGINGVIDRLEITDDGNIVIVDYKIGSTPTGKEILSGESIQVPLYALAIKEILSGYGLELTGCGYYKIKAGEVKRSPEIGEFATSRLKNKDLDEVLQKTQDVVLSVLSKIREGIFHLTLKNNECGRCYLWGVCREAFCEVGFRVNSQEENPNAFFNPIEDH